MPDDPLNLPDSTGPAFENLPEFAQNALDFEEFVTYLAENPNYFEQANAKILRATISDILDATEEINQLKTKLSQEELQREYDSRLQYSPTTSIRHIRALIEREIDQLEARLKAAQKEYSEGIAIVEITFVGKDVATANKWLNNEFIKKAQDLNGLIIKQNSTELDSGAFQISCTFAFGNTESLQSENIAEQ